MVTAKSKTDKYLTEITNKNTTCYADVTADKGGSGNHFRPHDFIEAGFASCLNITTRMVLESMNVPYEAVNVEVQLDRANEDKTVFKYSIDIIGDIDEKAKNTVLKIVRNCPVKKTLSKTIEFQG